MITLRSLIFFYLNIILIESRKKQTKYFGNSIISFFIFFLELTFLNTGTTLYVGDSCTDRLTQKIGVCRLASDCRSFSSSPEHKTTICGYDKKNPIVCCNTLPTHFKRQIRKEQQDSDACLVSGTNEEGTILQRKHCPIDKNLPQACPYEICKDLVCCPNNVERNRFKRSLNLFNKILKI